MNHGSAQTLIGALVATVKRRTSHSSTTSLAATIALTLWMLALWMLTLWMVTLPLSAAAQTQIQPQPQTQTLTLFEDVESPAESRAAPQRVMDATRGAPQFTLIGTSQLGDRHRARLRTADGENISVQLNRAGSTPIPGYPGYRIDEVGARHLVVQHPASAPCFESTAQGVSCAGEHVSHLELRTAQAIEPPAPVEESRRSRRDRAQAERSLEAEQAGLTRQEARRGPQNNPFAAALRAARERGDVPADASAGPRTESQRFQPRRIDPSQVPEGARVVRTPFGDRIVMD